MTTYVYETIPQKKGEKPKYYEFKQSMNDAPLEKHPETGESIQRVVLGGFGVLSGKSADSGSGGGCCAGPGCCG